MTTTLYRAADDTYTGYGSCYATDRAVAQTYHANPGMGGSTLISVQLPDDASIVQIDWATLEMLDELVGIETDHDWDFVYQAGEDTGWAGAREAGYDWVMYDEPQIGSSWEITTTLQYIGSSDAGAATVLYMLDEDAIDELDEQLGELCLEEYGDIADELGGIA